MGATWRAPYPPITPLTLITVTGALVTERTMKCDRARSPDHTRRVRAPSEDAVSVNGVNSVTGVASGPSGARAEPRGRRSKRPGGSRLFSRRSIFVAAEMQMRRRQEQRRGLGGRVKTLRDLEGRLPRG